MSRIETKSTLHLISNTSRKNNLPLKRVVTLAQTYFKNSFGREIRQDEMEYLITDYKRNNR